MDCVGSAPYMPYILVLVVLVLVLVLVVSVGTEPVVVVVVVVSSGEAGVDWLPLSWPPLEVDMSDGEARFETGGPGKT